MRIHDNSLFSEPFKARLVAAIERLRPGTESESRRRHEPFLAGNRFHDTGRVCYMGCGMLIDKHGDRAPAVADTLDGGVVDGLAMDSLVESASADHWYRYEKDWGIGEIEVEGES